LGNILKAESNFLDDKFTCKIGEFLGYFKRVKVLNFYYISCLKNAFDVDILRVQIFFDVGIFFDLKKAPLAFKKLGRLFFFGGGGKSPI
jgi:hypothetical protein